MHLHFLRRIHTDEPAQLLAETVGDCTALYIHLLVGGSVRRFIDAGRILVRIGTWLFCRLAKQSDRDVAAGFFHAVVLTRSSQGLPSTKYGPPGNERVAKISTRSQVRHRGGPNDRLICDSGVCQFRVRKSNQLAGNSLPHQPWRPHFVTGSQAEDQSLADCLRRGHGHAT